MIESNLDFLRTERAELASLLTRKFSFDKKSQFFFKTLKRLNTMYGIKNELFYFRTFSDAFQVDRFVVDKLFFRCKIKYEGFNFHFKIPVSLNFWAV